MYKYIIFCLARCGIQIRWFGRIHHKIVSNTLEKCNIELAIMELKKQGVHPLIILPDNIILTKIANISKQQQTILFLKSIVKYITQKVPIQDCMSHLVRVNFNYELRYIIEKTIYLMHDGASFASAINTHKNYFTAIDMMQIHIGEHCNQLLTVLEKIIVKHEMQQKLAQAITKSTIYPIIILSCTMGLAVIFIYILAPSIESLFTYSTITIPNNIKYILQIKQYLSHHSMELLHQTFSIMLIILLWP